MRTPLANYRELLGIRQKGRRRDVILIGSVFWIIFLALIFLGLTGQVVGRSIYIVTGIEVVFGAAYLMAWVRLEDIKTLIELLSNLPEEDE